MTQAQQELLLATLRSMNSRINRFTRVHVDDDHNYAQDESRINSLEILFVVEDTK